MPGALLELRSIGKRFGEDFSLSDISLDLRAGEVHAIAGENGSGKSALMKIVAGAYRPDSGDILIDGEPKRFSSISDSRRAGVSFQPQDPQVWDNLSVAENVYFGHMPRDRRFRLALDPWRLQAECLALFARLGIRIPPDGPISTLGYTQRNLVAATRACIEEARILIFDEPTAGMADPEREILFGIVRELRERGCGVFYITHKLDEIREVCDRVTVLRRGQVAGRLPREEADRGILISLMTGHIHAERYPRLSVERGEEVLSVSGLYSGQALRGVDFSLRKREILGITGLMGSGRTHLASCLFGQAKPSAGTVVIEGREVRFSHPSEGLRRGVALIPEDREQNAIFQQQDVLSNMTAASLRRFRGGGALDTIYMHSLTDEYIGSLSILPGGATDPIKEYSGGNQQKIVVARWLMSLCRIYIMDEPTRGVDAAARIDIYNAMNDLISKGASIILISSDIEEILGMCDRVLVLARGRIALELGQAEATKEKILDAAS
jgi:ribose transport system ATP-binding protein